MNDSIEIIKERIKNKRDNKISATKNIKPVDENKKIKYFKGLFSRFLIAIIFVLGSIIYVKYSSQNLLMYKKYILNDTWSFSKVNALYKKYFGEALPFDKLVKDNTNPVFNETLVFKSSESYLDGAALEVGTSYLVPSINSGIIVFIGEKEGYNQTVIVQGVDGVDIWYGGISHNNLKLYDYIEKGNLIGESLQDDVYIVIQKDGVFISYEEYTK